MKKILILEGSPRPNGNSCILSNEFARGAEEAGNRCHATGMADGQKRIKLHRAKTADHPKQKRPDGPLLFYGKVCFPSFAERKEPCIKALWHRWPSI